jgi:hypothetical protein
LGRAEDELKIVLPEMTRHMDQKIFHQHQLILSLPYWLSWPWMLMTPALESSSWASSTC